MIAMQHLECQKARFPFTMTPNKQKKKITEYEEKKKVALAVSKYQNIYDYQHKDYCNKKLEVSTWTKIAKETELGNTTCIRHWKSLKNSAKYYYINSEPKIVYENDSKSNELQIASTRTKYKSHWLYKDLMTFYTPPKQNSSSNLIYMSNVTDILAGELPDSNTKEKSSQGDRSPSQSIAASNILNESLNISDPEASLKHYAMWENLDTLASKLNKEVVDTLINQFMQMLKDTVKEKRELIVNGLKQSDEICTDSRAIIKSNLCTVEETHLNNDLIVNEADLNNDIIDNETEYNYDKKTIETENASDIIDWNVGQPTEESIEIYNPKWASSKYGKCAICGVIRADIKRHMKIHINKETEKTDKVSKQVKKSGICDICGTKSNNINKHIQSRHQDKHKNSNKKTIRIQNKNMNDQLTDTPTVKIFEEKTPVEKDNEIPKEVLLNRRGLCHLCGRVVLNIRVHVERHYNQVKNKQSDYDNVKNKSDEETVFRKAPVTKEKMCCICGKWMTTNLMHHMIQSHKSDKCKLLNEIKKDVEEGKTLPVPATCQLCDTFYDNILQHIQTLHLEPLVKYGGPTEVCYICGASVRHLTNHMFIHTSGSVTCDLCKKAFTNKRGLEWHMKSHLNIRNYKCKMCPGAFVTYSAWKTHTNSHLGIRKYKCNVCDTNYVHKSQLTKHMWIQHMGGYNLQCQFCEKTFNDKSGLRRHEKLHSNHKREYTCKFCPKILGSESGCYLHMRTHGRENPYACNICNMKFTHFGDYNTHMRRHKFNQI